MKKAFILLGVGLMTSLVCSCGDDENEGSGHVVEIEEEKQDSIPEFDVKVPNAKAMLQAETLPQCRRHLCLPAVITWFA